mmetsp:Transcript_99125/g.206627  ORF Transcript_99125/g.206627 Transcript_99125/m.206627 type:complete len:418 (+) Transcript_99125:91-1344(+)
MLNPGQVLPGVVVSSAMALSWHRQTLAREEPTRLQDLGAAATEWQRLRASLCTRLRGAPNRFLTASTGGGPLQCQVVAYACPEATGGESEFQTAYELLEELGRGTFGVVQRARHLATGQLRAVKRVRRNSLDASTAAAPTAATATAGATATETASASTSSPAGRSSSSDSEVPGAEDEVKALASLGHQNVIRFYEYFSTNEELLVVQELCEGAPLEALLERARGRGFGPSVETATMMKQMLKAVQHCHERGFVHRDLKVDNFIFAQEGPALQTELKLIDFGKALPRDEAEARESCAGTVGHASPESLTQGGGYGSASDMWALGAIFFLLLTGEPLIKVDCPPNVTSEEQLQYVRVQTARQVLDPRYVRLRVASACSRLPEEVGDLLRGLLKQDPKERMTAEEALRHPWIVHKAADKA